MQSNQPGHDARTISEQRAVGFAIGPSAADTYADG
jgi:hypothetical protein